MTASAEEAVERTAALLPDLVLLDDRLEGLLTGLQAAPLRESHHPAPVVLLCTALDREERAQAEPAVDGYLRKERLLDLVDVIRGLLAR